VEEEPFDRDAFLGRLVTMLVAGIGRPDTAHAVFHGQVDWHSAVHGHWALLRIARTTGEHADGALAVERSLAPEGIAREALLLREQPSFEMPYGRAWFLLPASEFESWCRASRREGADRLRTMADQVARSLRRYLEGRRPGPETAEYANDSWAIERLHAWYRFAEDAEGGAWAEEVVRRRFLAVEGGPTFARDAERPEFFSLYGNWACLVAATQDEETLANFLREHPAPDDALAPVRPRAGSAHHLGMNWSRTWALATLARRAPRPEDRERFCRACDAHARAGLRDHEIHASDHGSYGRWVPPFIVYALTVAP
jgi:hypothetical protein